MNGKLRVVYKYAVPDVNCMTEITLPLGAVVLSGGSQGESLSVWALVDPGRPPVKRLVLFLFTGFMVNVSGMTVYHVFTD